MTQAPTDRFVDLLVRGWRGLRWYAEGILGADAYRAYLAHHARQHGDEPPLSERDFWRDRLDWQERNPQGRCC